MDKSVSWPTAEMIGMEHANMARATDSSLKGHKSSSDPPPRPMMITSTALNAAMSFIASVRSNAALSPWTREGLRITST